ncbi:MAG: hypothetical protein J0H39_13835 [Alphaproteobacteria bacterium]|nr:hypothetical protein [Alphaproteobacteria bacterium]
MRAVIIGLVAALLAPCLVANGQNRQIRKTVGAWSITCNIDGMTDAAKCLMLATPTLRAGEFEGMGPVILWIEGEPEPGLRIIPAIPILPPKRPEFHLRIAKHAVVTYAVCDAGGGICTAAPSAETRQAREILAGATAALLRVGPIAGGRDWEFDVSGVLEARAELRALHVELNIPTSRRAFDEIERRAGR